VYCFVDIGIIACTEKTGTYSEHITVTKLELKNKLVAVLQAT
jgi:hypothetical protein